MKTTGFPQVAVLLASLALGLGACVHDTDGEVSSAEPPANGPEAVVDQATPGPDGMRARGFDRLKQRFEEADQNHDGKVSQQELQTTISAKFATLDTNRDGQLSEDELAAMRANGPGKRHGKGKMLAKIDTNGDGAIGRDEAPPRMLERFDEIDADGDGKLTDSELAAAWKKRGPRQGPGGKHEANRARLDADGDGVVSAEEFSQRALGWFERADANGDGTVELAELQAMPKAMRGMRGKHGPGKMGKGGFMAKHLLEADANGDGQITKAEAEAYKGAKFDELDKNGDGVLSADERPGRKAGAKAGRQGRMPKADADGDGTVSKAEFIAGAGRWFERLDVDGDEVLSKQELDGAKARMGRGMRGKRGPGAFGR